MKKNLLIAVSIVLLTGCVTDEEFSALRSRVNTIESSYAQINQEMNSVLQAMENFEKEVEDREKNLRSGYANLIAEKTSLKNKLWELNGEIEKIYFNLDSYSSKLDLIEKKFAVLEERTISVEDYLDFDKKGSPETMEQKEESQKTAEQQTKPEPDSFSLEKAGEEEVYEQAKKEFDLENFDKSMKFFIFHVKNFPKSSMADNSLFWIGEIYYKNGDYKRAIIEYQNVIEKYPSGNKVPAAYLKQGLAFYNIDRKDNAKIIFETLISKFPLSNEALIAKKKLKNF